jgi:hypothetical protein
VVLVPIMVYALTRLNKQYELEAHALGETLPRPPNHRSSVATSC